MGGIRAGGPTPTISAGVAAALAPPDFERLLRDADDALYAAKCTGRNRTVSQPEVANILRPGPMAAELTRLEATGVPLASLLGAMPKRLGVTQSPAG